MKFYIASNIWVKQAIVQNKDFIEKYIYDISVAKSKIETNKKEKTIPAWVREFVTDKDKLFELLEKRKLFQ